MNDLQHLQTSYDLALESLKAAHAAEVEALRATIEALKRPDSEKLAEANARIDALESEATTLRLERVGLNATITTLTNQVNSNNRARVAYFDVLAEIHRITSDALD